MPRCGQAAPRLVLDTNAVLDWLVFDNPASRIVTAAVVSGQVSWIVNEAVRDELAHVLGRGELIERWSPDTAQLWQAWERHATPIASPASPPMPHRLRCTDTDDQKFIDLAVVSGARWLITRDRAVLKLAGAAGQLKLAIVQPERFTLDWGP